MGDRTMLLDGRLIQVLNESLNAAAGVVFIDQKGGGPGVRLQDPLP